LRLHPIQRFGIKEEQFEYFMSEIYNKCHLLEIAPEQIGKYLAETVSMSKIVFPSEIPNYINTKNAEIQELEKQIENKSKTISELNDEIFNLEENQKSLIENNNISIDAINWYKDIKEEITNMGMPFDEIFVFIDCLRRIRSQGYDANKVVTKSSELINFSKFIDDQNEIKYSKINEIEKLKNIQKELEDQIGFIQLKLSKNQELENIGMGYNELKTIYNTVIEISKTNNINPKEAIEKFFNELNEYDDIVSFKKKVEDLKKEVATLNTQIANNRVTLLSQQQIGTRLQKLFQNGIFENDIVDINSILQSAGFDYDSNNNTINKQALISDLTKYQNIKSVIKELEQKEIKLKISISEFESQKKILENYINLLLTVIPNLVNLQSFLKKLNTILENPKIILICLFHNFFSKDDKKDYSIDNSNKDEDNNNI
jgi:hypothetical protein